MVHKLGTFVFVRQRAGASAGRAARRRRASPRARAGARPGGRRAAATSGARAAARPGRSAPGPSSARGQRAGRAERLGGERWTRTGVRSAGRRRSGEPACRRASRRRLAASAPGRRELDAARQLGELDAGELERGALAGDGLLARAGRAPVRRARGPWRRPGRSSSASPAATRPATRVPVTTTPCPLRRKARSIGSRAGASASAAAAGARSRAAAAPPRSAGDARRRSGPRPARPARRRSASRPAARRPRARRGRRARASTRSILVSATTRAGDAEQLGDLQVLAGLRPDPLVGGDDEQQEADAAEAGERVVQEALVPGNVDEAELQAALALEVGEAEVEGDAAPLLLGEPVAVDAGEGLDQRGLAVVDVAGGADEKRSAASAPLGSAAAGSSTREDRAARQVLGDADRAVVVADDAVHDGEAHARCRASCARRRAGRACRGPRPGCRGRCRRPRARAARRGARRGPRPLRAARSPRARCRAG